MGAWEYGALDNDPALEVLDRWEQWVEEPGIGYEAAIDQYFGYWGDAVRYGDTITNLEIIALAAIHLDKSIDLPDRLAMAAIDALNRELVAEELESWQDPKRREDVLLRMLSTLGGKRRAPRKPKFFSDPTIHFKNTAAARASLLALAKEAKQRGYIGFAEIMFDESVDVPPFLRTLHRLMMHRIWEKDWNIESQAAHERRMMLAWYATLASGGSVEDVAAALDNSEYPKQ